MIGLRTSVTLAMVARSNPAGTRDGDSGNTPCFIRVSRSSARVASADLMWHWAFLSAYSSSPSARPTWMKKKR